MRSGQLTILNKLGCIISTKYPRSDNPFEDEVAYAKNVLEGRVQNETLFALLFEPEESIQKQWATNNNVLARATRGADAAHRVGRFAATTEESRGAGKHTRKLFGASTATSSTRARAPRATSPSM